MSKPETPPRELTSADFDVLEKCKWIGNGILPPKIDDALDDDPRDYESVAREYG